MNEQSTLRLACGTRPRDAIGSASNSRAKNLASDTRSGHMLSFLLPLIQEMAVVSYWRKYVHLILVKVVFCGKYITLNKITKI